MKNLNTNATNEEKTTEVTNEVEKEEASIFGFNGKLPRFYGNCQDGFIIVYEYSLDEFEIINL